eukprot:COSAG05_NODE_341_length_11060_cov_29.709424_6_plen_104_part_00
MPSLVPTGSSYCRDFKNCTRPDLCALCILASTTAVDLSKGLVGSRRGDTSTIVPFCLLLIFMHCARLNHSLVARSASLGGAARGSAQRQNLVLLYGRYMYLAS